MSADRKLNVLIGSPLERVHVDRISAAGGDRVLVVFEPELLPVDRKSVV